MFLLQKNSFKENVLEYFLKNTNFVEVRLIRNFLYVWVCVCVFTNPLHPSRVWQEINFFKQSFTGFESRVFLLLDWRCPWCSRYRRRKWTRRYKFKSWTILIAFHIALIPLGKVWIQLFSLQLWVNSRTD